MNAAAYIDILENHLELDGLYNRDFIFQDDNAPCHRARIVTGWIDERWDHLEWPPHSPDLSPIENVWALVKDLLWRRRAQIHDRDDLWREAQRAWNSS